jgi:hypothetical protein
VALAISTRTMSLKIIIPNMEETKKTTKQSNVVKGIFGFVPFIGFSERPPLLAHL